MKPTCAAFWKTTATLIAGAFVTLALAAAERTPPGPVAEGIVELPPLEVSASISGTPWQYVRIANIEILTRCSDSATREFAQAHQRIEFLFTTFVPAEFQVKLAVPKIIVLSDQRSTPTASQELVTGFERSADVPPAVGDAAAAQRARAGAIRFLPNMRLNDVDMLAVFAIMDEGKFDGDRISLSRDHMRFLLERRCPPLPAWLFEGLMALCATVEYQRDALLFPSADWVTHAEEEKIRHDSDYPRMLLPMRDVFEVEFPPKRDETGDAPSRWRAQAGLFVRWAIDGNDPHRRQAFWKFAARACTEPVTEALFRESFGFGYSDLRDRLSDYLPVALKNTISLQAEKIPKLTVPKLRPATDAEIGRIKGDWERLEIAFVKARYPQFTAKYEEQANLTLTKAVARDPGDMALLAVVALNECDAGRGAKARPMLEAVAQANLVRPRVYIELARLRYAEAAEHPGGPGGLLDVAQANAVLQPLKKAWGQLPPIQQTYDLTAEVWIRSEARLSPTQLELLDEGLRYFPASPGLLYRVAVVRWLNGFEAEARGLAERGRKISEVPATKERFEKLLAAIAARRAAPAKP